MVLFDEGQSRYSVCCGPIIVEVVGVTTSVELELAEASGGLVDTRESLSGPSFFLSFSGFAACVAARPPATAAAIKMASAVMPKTIQNFFRLRPQTRLFCVTGRGSYCGFDSTGIEFGAPCTRTTSGAVSSLS